MLAQAPGWAWAKGGRGGDNHATECCVDAQGNVYVAGYFYGATEVIGSDTLYNSGIEDIFLAKYSPEGVALWGRDIGGSNTEFCNGLVCDPQGNVYLTGSFRSAVFHVDTVQLAITSAGYQDCFLAKFDSEGTVRMAKKFGGTEVDLGAGLVLGNGADLYLSGHYYSTDFSMDGIALPAPQGADWFIAKLDTLGTVAWVRTFGGPGGELGSHMALAPDGGVYWTGSCSSDTVVFDGDVVVNHLAGYTDAVVLRMDAGGAVQWADNVGGTENDFAVNIAADAAGNMYLAGEATSATLHVGASDVLSTPGRLFWSKWDPAGTVQYARRAEGSQLGDFEVSGGGDLVLGGSYLAGQFTIDGLTITNPYFPLGNTSNLFLMRTNAAGEVVWLKGATQSQQDDIVHALALNADSTGYVAGYYEEGGIQFDGQTVWDAGLNNGGFFVARFDPDAGVGMVEAAARSALLLYPNPSSGRFTVIADADIRSMDMVDCTGAIVPYQVRMRTARSAQIEMPGLASGLYLVVVHTPAGRLVQRLLRE
jgi:hypothetical protein